MSEEKHTIHIRIRDLRRANSLTQEELAEQLGISRQSINAMEAGRCLPSLPVALQIASFFEVPVHDIFGAENNTNNQLGKEPQMSTLTPWSPLRDMREMLDEMMDTNMAWATPATSMSIPAANLSQTETDIQVELRLPGFKKEELSIEVGEDFLTISGESKSESEETRQYIRREFASQSFSRTMALPALVETDGATAEMKHGVLHISLKKQIEEKPKTAKIEITAE